MGLSIAKQESAPALIALCAGAFALLSPTLALLVLGLLVAHALLTARDVRFEPIALAAPITAALFVGVSVGSAVAIGLLFAWRLVEDARWSIARARRLALAAGRP